MSFPVGSEHAAAPAAVPAPRTLRNSRRLRPDTERSAVEFGDSLISIVAVGAVVAGAFSQRVRSDGASRVRHVAGGALALNRIVPLHVTLHAPSHVERGVLVDTIHFLDLAVTRLAGDAGVDVAHVGKADVLGQLVNSDPWDRL